MYLCSERILTMPKTKRPEWLVPAGLIALSLIPVAAGVTETVGMRITKEIWSDIDFSLRTFPNGGHGALFRSGNHRRNRNSVRSYSLRQQTA